MDRINTVLITGATGTLGRAVVERFATRVPRGFRIVATSRATTTPFDGRDDIDVCGGIDLLNGQATHALAQRIAVAGGGRLSVVHCVGAFPAFARTTECDLDSADAVLSANYLTLFSTLKAFLPVMIDFGGGSIVAFSSHAVYQSYPLMSLFLPAKAAVESLIKCVANEYAGYGITANAFAPATIDSEVERSLVPYGDYVHWLQPSDVAGVVEGHVAADNPLMNGNVIQLFRHSDTYFGKGFLQRVGKTL